MLSDLCPPPDGLGDIKTKRKKDKSRKSGSSCVGSDSAQDSETRLCSAEEPENGTAFRLTWVKSPLTVCPRPDNRKCKCCRFRDAANDPVSKALGIIENMWWGYAPNEQGVPLARTAVSVRGTTTHASNAGACPYRTTRQNLDLIRQSSMPIKP